MACCEACGAKGCDGSDACGAMAAIHDADEERMIPKFLPAERVVFEFVEDKVSGHPDIVGAGAVPAYAGGGEKPIHRKFFSTNQPLTLGEAYTLISEIANRAGLSAYLPYPGGIPNSGTWIMPGGFIIPIVGGNALPGLALGPNNPMTQIFAGLGLPF